jgi:hypothetical protein
MIHYSCDRCQRDLEADVDVRYVVKIEVQAALEPLGLDDVEDDRDHLLEVHEILERLEEEEAGEVDVDVAQRRRFDLCPECYRKFLQNPLGRETKKQLGFSKN